MNHMHDVAVGPNMYILLYCRATPEQTVIIRKRVKTDKEEYIDILNYFIKESGHPGYNRTVLPENFPRPIFVEDDNIDNTTDYSIDPSREKEFQCGIYFFFAAQGTSNKTLVLKTAQSLLRQCSASLLQPFLQLEVILPT